MNEKSRRSKKVESRVKLTKVPLKFKQSRLQTFFIMHGNLARLKLKYQQTLLNIGFVPTTF